MVLESCESNIHSVCKIIKSFFIWNGTTQKNRLSTLIHKNIASKLIISCLKQSYKPIIWINLSLYAENMRDAKSSFN